MVATSVTGIGIGAVDVISLKGIKRDVHSIFNKLDEIDVSNDYYRNNYVIVRSVSDLPEPINGVHVLKENTSYELNGTIVSNNSLQYSHGSTINGKFARDTFFYTGNDVAIKADNIGSVVGHMFNVIAPNGSALDLSNDLEEQFFYFLVGFIDCKNYGTINGFNVSSFKSCLFEDRNKILNNGLTFSGESNKILIDGCPFLEMNDCNYIIKFNGNFKFVDIVGNYLKFNNELPQIILEEGGMIDRGIFRGNLIDETITNVTSGFNPNSVNWDFLINSGVKNSRSIGKLDIITSLETTITSLNVAVKVAGEASLTDISERFDMPENGKLRYIGLTGSRKFLIISNLTVDSSGNNQQLSFYIAKNGNIIEESRVIARTSAGNDIRSVSLSSIVELNFNDYVELFVANNTSTLNITLLDGNISAID